MKKILNSLLRHLAMEKYDGVRDPFMLMESYLDFTLRENEEDSVYISIVHGLKIKRTYLPFNPYPANVENMVSS
jgi:hypothetical protein